MIKICDQKEIARKGVHLLSIVFIIIYLVVGGIFGHTTGLFALSFLLIILIEFEYFRIELNMKIPVISWFWWVKREKEKHTLGAEVFFLIGTIICLSVFDLRVAVAAVLMTTFGDLAACIIGKSLGAHWIRGLRCRAWEGVIAELGVNIVVGMLILRTLVDGKVWWLGAAGMGQPIWLIIIPMAVTATYVETIIEKLDDNLLVPIFAGFTGQVILFAMSALF